MKPAELRLHLLDALSQLTKLRSEWRFGQTVANLAMTAGRMDAGGVWDLEDEEALLAAKTLIAQYSQIKSDADTRNDELHGNQSEKQGAFSGGDSPMS